MSEEEQWFTIFDILFPFHPRPKSACVTDDDLPNELRLYREFTTNEGHDILLQLLMDSGLVGDTEDARATTLAQLVIREGVPRLLERYNTNQPQNQYASNSSVNNNLGSSEVPLGRQPLASLLSPDNSHDN
jgi:hypothetical protein